MTAPTGEASLDGRYVFISASIPDPARWHGHFDALEITDAVVAIARTVLRHDGRIVTAAHPTIAPLLLYVAAEQSVYGEPPIVVYQSAVFDPILPAATRRFEADGVGTLIRTEPEGDEPPDPTRAPRSLERMRRQMLVDEAPAAAVFIGGMEGIQAEHALFSELRAGCPTYSFGVPGGAAQHLVAESPPELREDLANSSVYPALARRILDDLTRRVS